MHARRDTCCDYLLVIFYDNHRNLHSFMAKYCNKNKTIKKMFKSVVASAEFRLENSLKSTDK